jgi:hypothetical protein
MLVGSVLVIGEQLNLASTHTIHRDNERTIFAKIAVAPKGCKAFLATKPVNEARVGTIQVDAMLVAERVQVPTVNGYSGWVPPGWDLYAFDDRYFGHARHWVMSNGIAEGLCGCDLRSGTWSGIDERKVARYKLGSTIDFGKNGNAVWFQAEGWWSAEEGGTWRVGDRSILVLDIEAQPDTDLVLDIDGHAFAPPQRSPYAETVVFNRTPVAEWQISSPVLKSQIRIPRELVSSPLIRIEFVNHDPKAPADVGLSTDARKLGLALQRVSLQSAGKL